MSANKTEISLPPRKRAARSNESGPNLQPISAFNDSWATSFGRSTIVQWDPAAKQGWNGASGLLLFSRAHAKKSSNAPAISCG